MLSIPVLSIWTFNNNKYSTPSMKKSSQRISSKNGARHSGIFWTPFIRSSKSWKTAQITHQVVIPNEESHNYYFQIWVVLVCQGFPNKATETGWLRQYFIQVPKKSLKVIKVQVHGVGMLIPPSPQAFSLTSQSSPSAFSKIFHCMCLCFHFSFFLYRHQWPWMRAHSNLII